MANRRRAILGIILAAGAALFGAASHASAENTFIYGMPGPPETLDSAKETTERSLRVTWLLCEALINISKDGRSLEPDLAESWTISQDGLRADVKLRAGVRFHDGSVVDANAVKTSFERQFRPDHPLYTPDPRNTKEKLLTDLVEDITIRDPLNISFKLKYPGLHYFSQVDIVSPSALARSGKDFGRKPVCSGPFKLDTWSRRTIVLVANDQYWAGRPRIDRVVFRFIAEQRELLDGLLNGRIDFTPNVRDPVFLEQIRDSSRLRLLAVPGLNVYYLGFYTERPPFNNRILRRAVAHALDVSRMALFLGRGAAVVATGPLSPAMKGYDPHASQAAYDPAAARQLLTKAGPDWAGPVKLVHDSSVNMDAEYAGAIQANLRQIGITVELVGKPTSRDLVAAVRAREGDMFLYSWHVRAPYPERLLVPLFHSSAIPTTNLTQYKSPAVDRLLDEALRLPHGSALDRIYSDVQRLIVEDSPAVFLYHLTRMAVHGDRVRGLEVDVGNDPHDKLVHVELVR